MTNMVYLCAECLAVGTITTCGTEGGDALVCSVDPDHKLFTECVDKRE